MFDGSGGFPLAGSLCGIVPIWASEIEPYPIAVTKNRFPHMKHLGDISKVNGAEIEPVDVITFGSPCQDLSVAGKRAGLKHETNGDQETTRSGLFMEAIRIIKEMRRATNGKYPRFALWENVPGAFSSNKGEDFRTVLEELVKISETKATMPPAPKGGWPYADAYVGDGWSIAYRTFDAQYWGVPQRRRRIYLVADFAGGCAPGILFEREGVRGYFAQGKSPWKRIAADAQGSVGTNGCENKNNEIGNCVTLDSVASTLRAGAGAPKHIQDYIGRLVLKPVDTAMDGEISNGTITAAGPQKSVEINDCVKNCLTSWDYQTRRVCDSNGKWPTLTAGAITSGQNQQAVLQTVKPYAMGVDGYNCALTGNKASTLGVNCGMSTGRNGVLEKENAKEYTAFSQNQRNELRDLKGKTGALSAHHGMKQQTYIIEEVGNVPASVYSFDGLGSNSMKSKNPHSGCRQVEVAKTLDTTDPNPNKNQGGIAIVQPAVLFEPRSQDGVPRIHKEISPTLNTAQGGQRQPCVAVPVKQYPYCKSSRPCFKGDSETYIDCKVSNTLNTFDLGDKRANELIVETVPVYCVQGNCIDRADTAGCNGKGWREGASFTLNTIDRPAIAYAMTTGSFMQVNKEASPTLAARDYKAPPLVCFDDATQIYGQNSYAGYAEGIGGTLKASGGSYGGGSESLIVEYKPRYIVRRLTPTECARLQGFADEWGLIEHKNDLTDEEYRFWLDVRNTHAVINGRKEKEYTKAQILSWYNRLHSDSSEYKMWGNGVALPPTLYCMQGIKDALFNSLCAQEKKEDLP